MEYFIVVSVIIYLLSKLFSGPKIDKPQSTYYRDQSSEPSAWTSVTFTNGSSAQTERKKHVIPAASIETMMKAINETFIVADTETTGFSPTSNELTEIAAVKVDRSGAVIAEFSSLIKINGSVPRKITELTGINKRMLNAQGRLLEDVMKEFSLFVGGVPIFFYNAPFDAGFIAQASKVTGVMIKNPIYDALAVARKAWPNLQNHKLATVAAHISAPAAGHRALMDAKATMRVLIEACKILTSSGPPTQHDQ